MEIFSFTSAAVTTCSFISGLNRIFSSSFSGLACRDLIIIMFVANLVASPWRPVVVAIIAAEASKAPFSPPLLLEVFNGFVFCFFAK